MKIVKNSDPQKYRFYGRRLSRPLKDKEKVLIEANASELFFDLDQGELDLQIPTQLEIGFGDGEHLIWQAQNNPDVQFIGADPYINGVVKLIRKILDLGIKNIKIFPEDTRFLLEKLPKNCLDKVYVLFPDPWPKKKHHKRRIISTENLDMFAACLKQGGELRVGTDDRAYLNWILHHVGKHEEYIWTAGQSSDWLNRPDDWPETRYAQKAREVGRQCSFLIYKKI